MLIERRLKVSGSSSDGASAVFAIEFGDNNLGFVLPLSARSTLDGIFWRDSRVSSSLSRVILVVDDVWRCCWLLCDIFTWIHCKQE